MWRRAFFVVCLLINGSVGVLALWFFFRPGSIHVPVFRPAQVITPPQIEYKDFVAILLTAFAVMLALGTLAIAALAVFGYAEGRRMFHEAVQREVSAKLDPAVLRAVMAAKSTETSDVDADMIAAAQDDAHGR